MRINRSATGNRRSHHGLKEPRLSKCANCNGMHLKHRLCEQCGTYRGRKVVDVEAQLAKKLERQKRKLKERGEDPTKAEEAKAAEESSPKAKASK